MKAPFQLYGIFGYPLGHTLSPRMQEAAFEASGIKAYYLVLELDRSHFHKLMKGISRLLLNGFNVTVPYKGEILPYLDGLSPEAKAVKAVNTVYRSGSRWVGTNTDIYGFLTSLRHDGRFNPRGKKVLVLGAGGSARAVVYGLAKQGAREIQMAARRPLRARAIIRDFKKSFRKTTFEAFTLKQNDLKKALQNADLVVNTTSVGLDPRDRSLIPVSVIPPANRGRKILFFDLIYHRPTEFLKNAGRKGHSAVGGLGMLLFQGARAFEYWTGKKAPVTVMRKALTLSLRTPKG